MNSFSGWDVPKKVVPSAPYSFEILICSRSPSVEFEAREDTFAMPGKRECLPRVPFAARRVYFRNTSWFSA